MAEYTDYHAYWHGPFAATYDGEDGYTIDLPENLNGNHGLYAIYGRHPVYGADTLLYIGKTGEGKAGEGERGFTIRFGEHFSQTKKKTGLFWYSLDPKVYVATLWDGDVSKDRQITKDEDGLTVAEALLIASHTPAMNQKHIHIPPAEAKDVLLYNFENRGSLLPICSGRWFSYGDDA